LSKAWLSVSVPQITVNVSLDPDVVSGSLKQISGLNIIWSELCSAHDAVGSQTDPLYTTTICDLISTVVGRDMIQVVSFRPLTAEFLVLSQESLF